MKHVFGRNLITLFQQKTAVREHETMRSWSHCGSNCFSSWSSGSSTNVAFSFLTDCLKKGYPNEEWIQIGSWRSDMIGIRFHPLQTSMKHLNPWGPTLETKFLCASSGKMDRRGNILKTRTWASKRISKRANKYVLERETWENKYSYSNKEYDEKLGFRCVSCLNQTGREVLWLSGLLIRRLMALHCRLLSSKGISLGSVICVIASFCSGLKHFTCLTLSSSVLRTPQISRQLKHDKHTGIAKDHYAIDRNWTWSPFGRWTRLGLCSGPGSSSQQQM